MRNLTFWLEIVENVSYRKVRIDGSTSQEINIIFVDNAALNKNTMPIKLHNAHVSYNTTYMSLIGYESLGEKKYKLIGYYLYNVKPRTK